MGLAVFFCFPLGGGGGLVDNPSSKTRRREGEKIRWGACTRTIPAETINFFFFCSCTFTYIHTYISYHNIT